MGDRAERQEGDDKAQDDEPFAVNIEVAQPTRVRDAILGGSSNFSVDRAAADELSSSVPGGAETLQRLLRLNGDFRHRVLRHLVTGEGVRQFLQLGTSAPIGRTTHEVAQELAPDCRVVHCVEDPVGLAHAHELRGSPEGAVDVVVGSLRHPREILAGAAATLDLSRPVGLAALALSVVPDEDDPWTAIAELLAGLSSGSYLIVVQLGRDISPEQFAPLSQRHDKLAAERRMRPLYPRRRADVERLFESLELIEPGIVRVDQWRPDETATPLRDDDLVTPFYGAVGMK